MAGFSVRFGTEDALSALDHVSAASLIARRRAVRRTAASVRTFMGREVARDTGLRVRTVNDEVKVRIDDHDASATISISGSRIPLIDFHARGPEPSRGKGRGVTASVQGQRKRYPNAFISTMRSGHRGVFQRKARRRLPIVELRGPSLPHVFAKFIPLGVQRAEELIEKNLEHELEFALSQE
jgi:hypothetical protein